MNKDKIYNKFKPNVYMKPDAYLNGWARKCGWKATIVYDSLWRHADVEGTSFPSIKLLAEEHNVSRDTIIRGLKTLIEFNLVKKEAKRDKKGRFLHNVYTLTDKSEWVDTPKSPTATRLSKSLTATTQVAHSDYKDTHNKDTHILSSEDNTQSVAKAVVKKEKPSSAKTTHGNQDINDLLSYIKERMGLPILNGTTKDNRLCAYNALRKFGGLEKCKLIVDAAADDDWWRYRLTSARDLLYNGIKIISTSRSKRRQALTLKRNEKGEVVEIE